MQAAMSTEDRVHARELGTRGGHGGVVESAASPSSPATCDTGPVSTTGNPEGPRSRTTRATIAVIGNGDAEPGSLRFRLAEAIGEGLLDAGHRLVTGGRGGVMEAACRGAHRSRAWTEGSTIGVLPGTDPAAANPWVDVPLCTGLGHGRNRVVAQSSAVIAIGGGAGTLSEIAFAWISRRLVIGLRCGGWSERLADRPVDERPRFIDLADDRVHGADDAAEALRLLAELLPRYAGATAS